MVCVLCCNLTLCFNVIFQFFEKKDIFVAWVLKCNPVLETGVLDEELPYSRLD